MSQNHKFGLLLGMPPSTNKIYVKMHRGLTLSTEARQYQQHVNNAVSQKINELKDFPIDLETMYRMDLCMALENVENPGWFKVKKNGERDAKTRYKRIDVDNRVKFVQDCFTKAIGIPDDSQIFFSTQSKMRSLDGTEGVYVSISVINEREQFLRGGPDGG